MTFTRSLVFAALAGSGLPLFTALGGPFLGAALAVKLYGVATAVAFAGAIAPTARRAVVAMALVACAGFVLLALPLGLPGLVLGLAATLGACRSGFLHRSSGARGLGLEVVLQTLGLLLAAFLVARDPISLALATWGYYLAQSLYFLVGGIEPRRSAPRGDPFDEARGRLLALLD